MHIKAAKENQIEVTPFLKWAGGKRWLVSTFPNLFPTNYKLYIEPFLGSAAVYFHMRPKYAVLGDLNQDLINAYIAIRDDWKNVEKLLKYFHRKHCKEFYYEIRDKNFRSKTKRAAQFIYLNRTCWNGLYRVNLKGSFNVPIGTKKNVILDTDNFEATSNSLRNTELKISDFKETIDHAGKNDFLFIDPPYTVKHNLNGFIKYNDKLFTWEDQLRLRDCIENAASRGAKIMLTNANHQSVRDLYKDLGTLKSLKRPSVISGSAKARGTFSELIVRCY